MQEAELAHTARNLVQDFTNNVLELDLKDAFINSQAEGFTQSY